MSTRREEERSSAKTADADERNGSAGEEEVEEYLVEEARRLLGETPDEGDARRLALLLLRESQAADAWWDAFVGGEKADFDKACAERDKARKELTAAPGGKEWLKWQTA